MRTLVLLWVLAATAQAQGFSLVSEKVISAEQNEESNSTIDLVQSAQSYDTGDLIVLDVTGTSPAAITTNVKWLVIPDANHLVWPDGTKLVMSTGKFVSSSASVISMIFLIGPLNTAIIS